MENRKRKPIVNWIIFLVTVVAVFLLGLFANSIMERKAETAVLDKPMVEISEFEPRNEVWEKNYPKQYQSYMRTADTSFRSKYNGNKMIDMLEEDPRLVILWAGYGFSKDYNQGRGHYYAVTDIRNTLRTGAPKDKKDGPMPGTCWACKSPDVPRLIDQIGPEEFYKGKWAEKGHEIVNHIGCADCHDPETMNLRITRPALSEAFERRGVDIELASHQDMRSLVCAQCHVEYYFKGDGKYLTFPWDKGMTVEDMEKYYDEAEFSDWTHALSRAPMLKAQHPGYETFLTGIHAQRGVSCADCHMPYHSEGGQKFTNHQMQSPLNNISASCVVCHRESEAVLMANVYERQDKIIENRDKAEMLLVRAHLEAKAAWDAGATEEEMADVLQMIRHAQWRWDFAAAAHGASFHSPIEISRIISTSIERSQEARILLARILIKYGVEPVLYPEEALKSKATAQEFINLDVKKMEEEKKVFLSTVVEEWDKQAAEREKGY